MADDRGGCEPVLSSSCEKGSMPSLGSTECERVGVLPTWTEPSVESGSWGVTPADCADGFASDGGNGCIAILPAQPCEPTTLALPGDSECHPVSDCGEAPYGNLAVSILADPSTLFVDRNYDPVVGGASDGTSVHPFTTIQAAIDASTWGVNIVVADGSYKENIEITAHPLKLWGRCSDAVEIYGQAGVQGTVLITHTNNTELHGFRVTGDSDGAAIVVISAKQVLVDGVRIDSTAHHGVSVEGPGVLGASAIIQDSLIDGAHDAGVLVLSAAATVSRSVIRNTVSGGSSTSAGFGIELDSQPAYGASTLVLWIR
ncbi:MAG: DUF1565 domain-containing protein [Polyangiaceae bacterium]